MAHCILRHDWARELPFLESSLELQELGHVVEVLSLLFLKMLKDFLGRIMVLCWAIESRNMVENRSIW